jgi:hypothetical protein
VPPAAHRLLQVPHSPAHHREEVFRHGGGGWPLGQAWQRA